MSVLERASRSLGRWRERASRTIQEWGDSIYVDAAKEFATVLVLSNLPFGAIILSHYIGTPDAPFSWDEVAGVIAKNWKPGEILILVSALLAPFSYLMAVYHRARRHMPWYSVLSIVLVLMYFGAAYFFAYDRMQAIKNEPFIRVFSLVLYGGAVVIWYLGLVFQRKLNKPPTDEGSKRADNIAAQLQQEEA